MSSVEISRVLAEMRALAARSQGAATQVQDAGGSFGNLLKQSIDAVDAQRQEASRLAESFEVGATQDLASVMLASQKANLSFQAMVTVRNRLVEAYKDVMNMPI
jgi:flagellar hook-basal body complex protein FliE